MHNDPLLKEQVEYYRARATEYDEWFFRTGRYDRGPEHRATWLGELAVVEAALRDGLPPGDVLELACGTGLWTRHLVEHHSRVVVADLVSWVPPAAQFDAIFFGFWLSHVPLTRFDAFWTNVRAALKPRAVAFFVDSLLEPGSTARDHEPLDKSGIVRRRLNDGREFSLVKVFHEPAVLEQRLAESGWTGWIRSTGKFFLYGCVTPTGE